MEVILRVELVLPNGQRMTCERICSPGAPIGERTRISARHSVILLPLKAYALGWSMRLLASILSVTTLKQCLRASLT
jgi:hypothetical protein